MGISNKERTRRGEVPQEDWLEGEQRERLSERNVLLPFSFIRECYRVVIVVDVVVGCRVR